MDAEKARLKIDIQTSRNACAGAAAAFVLRRIAARAGTYAPGIHERLFFDLSRPSSGRDLDKVEGWFGSWGGELSRLGYRVLARRIAAPTEEVVAWVGDSEGFRGAVLATEGGRLHGAKMVVPHAVAVVREHASAGAEGDGVLIVDPWPSQGVGGPPPAVLDLAHRDCKYASLLLFWSGHS